MKLKVLNFLTAIILSSFCIFPVIAQQETVSLTSGGAAFVSGYSPMTPLSVNSPIGTPINARLNFGDISPKGMGKFVRITLPVRISATSGYRVEIQRASSPNDDFDLSNIGFSIGNARPQTTINPALANDAANISVVHPFGISKSVSSRKTSSYSATFANVSETPTLVFTGNPTVAKGILGDDGSSILVDFTFTIAAQYYTPQNLMNLTLNLKITPN